AASLACTSCRSCWICCCCASSACFISCSCWLRSAVEAFLLVALFARVLVLLEPAACPAGPAHALPVMASDSAHAINRFIFPPAEIGTSTNQLLINFVWGTDDNTGSAFCGLLRSHEF